MYDLGIFISGTKEVQFKLGLVIKDSDNLMPAFEQIARLFWNAELGQFESDGARGGEPWEPLSRAYRTRKARQFPGRPILVATGELKQSLTGKSGRSYFSADAHRMKIGTTVPYARFHQSGTRSMPRRPVIALTEDDAKEFGRQIQLHVMKGLTGAERAARKVFL